MKGAPRLWALVFPLGNIEREPRRTEGRAVIFPLSSTVKKQNGQSRERRAVEECFDPHLA